MRRLRLGLLAALVVALGACAPIAQLLPPLLEHNDGAALTYVLADQPGGPGLEFDPGQAVARGVIVRADGINLVLLSQPEGAECTVTDTELDCRLGNVSAAVLIGLSGQDVLANATWRRTDSTVYRTFARLENVHVPP